VIARVSGILAAKEVDRVEIMTAAGVGYELVVPLSVHEGLPRLGEVVTLHTHLVVKEDGWQLFGFTTPFERQVFQRVLGAKGVGPALAIGLLSTLTAARLVRALREHDVATLQSAPRVGRKKAEQLILDLADKLDDLDVPGAAARLRPEGAGADEAMRALVSLGYSASDAEQAVRAALDASDGGLAIPDLIRVALAKVTS
jgi:holliday junction DNA helicase RuvA